MSLFCSITKEVSFYFKYWWLHCVKSVHIRSFLVSIQPECGKIQTRKTPNTDTFHAVLLLHFRQLLLDCGIGVTDSSNSNDDALNSAVVSQHRALVFCQLKSMLDLVENTLLKWELIEFTLNYYYSSSNIFSFKVNNGNTRILCEISPKLAINTPEERHLTSFWRLSC